MTMMQAFEWYVPADHQHWKRLEGQLSQLKAFGIDNHWIRRDAKHLLNKAMATIFMTSMT
jgi:hypothetical protein